MRLEWIKGVKEKVTVTLSPQVIRKIDRWCEEMKVNSRSAAVEHFLQISISSDEERRLEAATEAYYRSLSDKEKKEDRDWARPSSRQAVHRLILDEKE